MMGWSIGYDERWERDIGYGVPATCDHPACGLEIDRGLAHVCCGQEPYGGEHGCGLFFCYEHLNYGDDENMPRRCFCCNSGLRPFDKTPDVREWTHHKETDESWAEWRAERDESMAEQK